MLLLRSTLYQQQLQRLEMPFAISLRPLAHSWKILENEDCGLSVRMAFVFSFRPSCFSKPTLQSRLFLSRRNGPVARAVITLQLFDSSFDRCDSQPLCVLTALFFLICDRSVVSTRRPLKDVARSESSKPLLVVASIRLSTQHLLRITACALCFLHVSHPARPWPTGLRCRDGSAVFVEDRLLS